MITATIRLQECRGDKFRRGFVAKGRPDHGIAKGRIRRFEVSYNSWPYIRRMLKEFEHGVMGHSNVRPDTVDSYSIETESREAGIRELMEPYEQRQA